MPVSSSSPPSPSDSMAPSLPYSAGTGDKEEEGAAAVAAATMSSGSDPASHLPTGGGGRMGSAEPNSNPYDGESEEGVEVWEEPLKPTPRLTSGSKRSRADRAAEVHSLEEKRRRTRINEKMKALQNLIPNSNKKDKLSMQSMLDEAVEYVKQLQLQVQTWELLAARSQSSSAVGPSTALGVVPSAAAGAPASPAVTPVASSAAPPAAALAVPLAVPFSELCKFQAALEAATTARADAEAKVLYLERRLVESTARVRQLEGELGIEHARPPPAAGEGSSGASTELLRAQLQLEAAEETVAKLRQELRAVTDKFQDTVAVRLRAEWMVERRSEELKKLTAKYDDLKARFDTVTLKLTRSRDDPVSDSVRDLLADTVMARALFPQADVEATSALRPRQGVVSVAGESDSSSRPPSRPRTRQPTQGGDGGATMMEGEAVTKETPVERETPAGTEPPPERESSPGGGES